MKSFLSLFILSFFFHLAPAKAQRLNVILHPLAQTEVTQDFTCIKKNNDLIVSFGFKTFQAEPTSFLRLEVFQLEENKPFSIKYNNQEQRNISKDKPYFLHQVRGGEQKHYYLLQIKKTPLNHCEHILDTLQLSFEPA